MKTILFILILTISNIALSQNMIRNPNFSDIEIEFRNGKKVFPNYWKSYDMLNFYTIFSHPAKYIDTNLLGKPTDFSNQSGFFWLDIIHHSMGIYTELRSTLEKGNSYNIEVELLIDRVKLDSDFRTSSYDSKTRKIKDSADFDYNYIVSLVTYFMSENPNIENKAERKYAIFDFPDQITPDSTGNWIALSKIYIANGNEKYYAIGTYSSQDYINILRTENNDTTDYKHKWASYLIRKVSITPLTKKSEIILSNTFEPDSIFQMSNKTIFIIRTINFDLNSYVLDKNSLKEIEKIATYMKTNKDLNLNIIGHTDSLGTVEYNQVLSEKRALSVYNELVNYGVLKEKLKYEGKGKNKPLDESLYKENFGRNRRVEFEFIKK